MASDSSTCGFHLGLLYAHLGGNPGGVSVSGLRAASFPPSLPGGVVPTLLPLPLGGSLAQLWDYALRRSSCWGVGVLSVRALALHKGSGTWRPCQGEMASGLLK